MLHVEHGTGRGTWIWKPESRVDRYRFMDESRGVSGETRASDRGRGVRVTGALVDRDRGEWVGARSWGRARAAGAGWDMAFSRGEERSDGTAAALARDVELTRFAAGGGMELGLDRDRRENVIRSENGEWIGFPLTPRSPLPPASSREGVEVLYPGSPGAGTSGSSAANRADPAAHYFRSAGRRRLSVVRPMRIVSSTLAAYRGSRRERNELISRGPVTFPTSVAFQLATCETIRS